MKLRILIADDDEFALATVRKIIFSRKKHSIVGEAKDGAAAVQMAMELKPDLIFMDSDLPVMNGIDATRCIMQKLPGIKIIGLSSVADGEWVHRMRNAGAVGIMLKRIKTLWLAIDTVAKGTSYLDSELANSSTKTRSEHADLVKLALAIFTPRQKEVLKLMGRGLRNKEIASKLSVTVKAIDKHRRKMMRKLSLRNSNCLTVFSGQAIGLI